MLSHADRVAARIKVAHENITHHFPELIPSLAIPFHRAAYYPTLLPTTEPVKLKHATRFYVAQQDTLTCAKALVRAHGSDKVAVLNMANHKQPGGGFLTGAGAQEEAMCRRSTLFLHLTQTQGTLGKMYPFPKHVSAIWTPGVRVFRDEGAAHYNVWPDHQRFDVAVITAAAVQNPPLDRTGQEFKYVADVQRTRVKMAQILRIAKAQGITHLVLGAFGCGAFGNPPPAIAKLWWEALFQPDVRGAFTEVWFAVIDKSGSSNYPIFHAMFHGKVDSGL